MLYIINAVVLVLLFAVWSKSNITNFIIKASFLTLALVNAFYALQAYGYVVRTF